MGLASLFALGFLLLADPNASVQDDSSTRFRFFPNGNYDSNVPTPDSILGYPLGSRFTETWRIRPYLEALTKSSPRLSWISYGKTAENRPLLLAAITSPQNRAKLDKIKADCAKLCDPRTLTSTMTRDEILDSSPVVVWFSFNVHGNEASCTEAALALLYQLAAGTDRKTTTILDNAVVLIDPCLNPDGRDRYVNWYQSVVGARPNPDPKSMEHDEPWPGGRTNHYYFDLNRDWAFLTQTESKARIAAYLQWNPQVHVDFHEMDADSSYFFFPADFPINLNLPTSTLEWQRVFGKGNAASFDRFGWFYYTGERFDLFYPGYGDSWPSLQGAIGMTYEQAGHGAAGLSIRRRDEQVLTLYDRTWHHFTAAMSTLETAATNRRDILSDFHKFFKTALEDAKDKKPKAYILKEGSDPARVSSLVGLLISQGIEVYKAKQSFLAGPVGKFGGGQIEKEKFTEGSYVIPLSQPRRRLANALLEPEPAVLDLYFYDVSAWSLPLAFGVEAYWSDEPIEAPLELLKESTISPSLKPRKATYAYLIPWDSGGAPALLYHLAQENFVTRIANREFRIGKTDYPRGTVIVPVFGNPDSIHERMSSLASRWNVSVQSVETGMADRGIDLGSDRVIPFRAKKIAVATGDGVSPASYGAIRFLLEKENEIEFSSISLDAIERADLSSFQTLVFPDGWAYSDKLDKDTIKKIERWVRNGGSLITIGGAAVWATASRSGLTKNELAAETVANPAKTEKKWIRIEEAEAQRRQREIPGTILSVSLDDAHPISFGYGAGPIFVMQQSGRAFNLPEDGVAVGVYADEPKIAGYISHDDAKKFIKKAYLIESPLGEGRVILFVEDPNFRLTWHGLTKLFLNAVLLPR